MAGKGKPGRPRKLKEKAEFLEAVEGKLAVRAAARAVGVARSTIYRWRDEDKAFEEEVKERQECAIDRLEASTYEQAMQPDSPPVLKIFMLKSWRPERYRETVGVEHGISAELQRVLDVQRREWRQLEMEGPQQGALPPSDYEDAEYMSGALPDLA